MPTLPHRIKKLIDGWNARIVPALLEGGIFEACCRAIDGTDHLFEAVGSSKNTAVFRFEWRGRSYYLKHYLFGGWRKYFSLRAKVKRLPLIADQLRQAGFHTPEIVCIAFHGRQMFSVSEAADADTSIADVFFATGRYKVENVSRFRELVGREVGRLHQAGFVHGDLRWGNLLVRALDDEDPVFIYIDNDRTRKYWRIPARLRVKNLVQLKFPGRIDGQDETVWKQLWAGYIAVNKVAAKRMDYWSWRVEQKTKKRVKLWRRKTQNHDICITSFGGKINE